METQTCFLVELIEINHFCQYFCLTLALPISFHVRHKSSHPIAIYHINAVTAAVVSLLIMQEFSACEGLHKVNIYCTVQCLNCTLYTLLNPFINNLFDWWTLRMTTMSTSSPSIFIIVILTHTVFTCLPKIRWWMLAW